MQYYLFPVLVQIFDLFQSNPSRGKCHYNLPLRELNKKGSVYLASEVGRSVVDTILGRLCAILTCCLGIRGDDKKNRTDLNI